MEKLVWGVLICFFLGVLNLTICKFDNGSEFNFGAGIFGLVASCFLCLLIIFEGGG